MSHQNFTVDQVDALLPQTQCGLCDHGACRPYAEAIVFQNDSINRCPPGGVKTLKKLSELTGIDSTPYEKEMEEKAIPSQKIVIREDICIGCTKCIQACPVDAILGASKLMHTVITDECTGCELCIEPCPMDCIDIVPTNELDDKTQLAFSNHSRKRYEFREARLDRISLEKKAKHLNAKKSLTDRSSIVRARQAEIQAAIARSRSKKLQG